MAIVIKPITVEVSKPNVFQAIAAKQNDSNSRFLKVTFVNEGEKIYVTPSARVTINAERNDGNSNSFFGEVNNDGTVTVPIHSWILELPGYVNCDVSIIEADSKLTSTTFTLLVEEASHGDGAVSEDPQSDALGELIKEVEALENGMNNVFASAIPNTARGSIVSLTDISPLEHILRVKARSENIVPTPFLVSGTNTTNGVTYTINSDYSISASGKPTKTTARELKSNIDVKEYRGKCISVIPGNRDIKAYLYVHVDYDDGTSTTYNFLESTGITSRVLPMNARAISVGIAFLDTYNGEETTLYPYIKVGESANTYKPYVEDVSTAKVQRYGGNILPFPYYYSSRTLNGVEFIVNDDTSVTVRGTATANTYFYLVVGKEFGEKSMNAQANESATNGEYVLSEHLMYYATGKELYIYVRNGTSINKTLYPQLYYGTELPPYEPSKNPTTYSINADGTVEGVTSLSPTTTLYTNIDGVVIDVNYNADTKKYIDNKFTEVNNKIAELAAAIVNS